MPRQLRTIVGFNAHVGRKPSKVVRSVRRLIRDTDVDVICLQESRGYITALRLAFPTWRVYAKGSWPDSQHNPVMVRRSLSRGMRYGHGWGTVRVEQGWTYEGTPKPGRTWTWVRVEDTFILSLHRVRGGHGTNNDSYAEEADKLREWFAEHDRAVAVGDANEEPDDARPDTVLRIAREVRGRLLFDCADPGIDYALGRNVDGDLKRLPDYYGSDHRPTVLTLHVPQRPDVRGRDIPLPG